MTTTPEDEALIREAVTVGLTVGWLNGARVVVDQCYFSYMANRKSSPMTKEGIAEAASPYLTHRLESYRLGHLKTGKRHEKTIEKVLAFRDPALLAS
jgi:hypothetical protein